MRFFTFAVLAFVVFVVQAEPLYFPDWKQCYYVWAKDVMGTSNETLCTKGDLVTCYSIYLAARGIPHNPRSINAWLTKNDYYSGYSMLVKMTDKLNVTTYIGYYKDLRYEQVRNFIDQKNCVIAYINACNNKHYILLTGYDNVSWTYYARDPTGCFGENDKVHAGYIERYDLWK